jgi:hypothetical protein
MQYQETLPISFKEAEEKLESDDPKRINDALIRLTYHDSDWQWVQDQCLQLVNYSGPVVKGPAISCLGHLARITRLSTQPRYYQFLTIFSTIQILVVEQKML